METDNSVEAMQPSCHMAIRCFLASLFFFLIRLQGRETFRLRLHRGCRQLYWMGDVHTRNGFAKME